MTLKTVEAPPPATDCPLTPNSSRSSSHSITVRFVLSTFPPAINVTLTLERRTGTVATFFSLASPCGYQRCNLGNTRLVPVARISTIPTLDSPKDQRYLGGRTATSPL